MYSVLDKDIEQKIKRDREKGVFFGTPDGAAIRLNKHKDAATLIRPAFVRDIAKIINLPIYSRLQDKTQVLSLFHNDDISHRMLHVQLVSRIARDISRALALNEDLTEVIALGHDVGHTPFGHAGERMLDKLMNESAGLYFSHNVQSARALSVLYPCNLTLQALDGILTHNGELVCSEYKPGDIKDFNYLYERIAACEKKGEPAVKKLIPSTLEGCVVRISDMIAYLGKDRQDAARVGLVDENHYSDGLSNSEIINNITIDIVEHSYGKNHISMSGKVFKLLEDAKRENNDLIYRSDKVSGIYREMEPKFKELFDYLVSDAKRKDGVVYNTHVKPILEFNSNYDEEPPVRLACDFIASMTDDYFVDIYERLIGKEFGIDYKRYFDD
ncbi:MAG: HD domain-containing protein [Clostridiales bacterium]|nr:HD domain-containing protein [Clostridiales bacterium]